MIFTIGKSEEIDQLHSEETWGRSLIAKLCFLIKIDRLR